MTEILLDWLSDFGECLLVLFLITSTIAVIIALIIVLPLMFKIIIFIGFVVAMAYATIIFRRRYKEGQYDELLKH